MWQLLFVAFCISVLDTVVGYPLSNDDGPLFLTPLLKEGNITRAQELSRVGGSVGRVTSHAGYITVDEQCKSHLYFWFFPSLRQDWEDAPLLLWLQGGPGASSLFGLFQEIGPFEVLENGELKQRKYSWNTKVNVIFVDQPVGTGFSFTERGCFAKDQTDVSDDLYEFIVQFYTLFPKLLKNKLILAGESFAGRFIPAIGHTIHKRNLTAQVKINLSAMMIGNGNLDPVLQIDYASYLYQLGVIDNAGRDKLQSLQVKFVSEANLRDWSKAAATRMDIIDFYKDSVGGNNYKYSLIKSINIIDASWVNFLNDPNIQRSIHVGSRHYDVLDSEVFDNLRYNLPQSVKPWVEELLPYYPIVFYFGQLDIVAGYAQGVNFLRALDWEGQHRYLNATRSQWCVGEERAGYFKGEHHLYEVLVRGAGHMVPLDQPLWAYELVNSITSGTLDNPLHALHTCN